MLSSPKQMLRAWRRRRPVLFWLLAVSLGLVAFGLCALRLVPLLVPYSGQARLDTFKFSRVILDVEGGELQILPLENGLRRVYISRDRAPQELLDLIVHAEDRRFYWHFGVDPLALLRASAQNLFNARLVSGASTISMQVARMIVPRQRGWLSKFQEAWEAMQLEARLGKKGILELYVNLVPFGRNVEGFEAAARVYFGKKLETLGRSELLILCILPRAPIAYDPSAHPGVLRAAIARLDTDASRGSFEALDRALAEVMPADATNLWPFRTPHFVAYLSALQPWAGIDSRIPFRSGIEPKLQAWLEDFVASNVEKARRKRVSNASALFVRPEDMRIAAWVGSVNFFDSPGAGQVDGVLMKRQPGSTLKPFLYSLAISRGFTAATILPDIPSDFGGAEVYVPANFNNQFNGPIRLRQALASSLNIPAVYTLERLGLIPFSRFLIDAGFTSLAQQQGKLGLGLALGGADISLFELVQGYGLFLNDGIPAQLNAAPGGSRYSQKKMSLLDPKISGLIRDILTRHPDRTLAFGIESRGRMRFESAVKTGTSNQFNNIWAVGFTPDLLGGVWMGNFSGATVVGTADSGYPATILYKTLETFSEHPGFPAITDLVQVEICSLSGMEATSLCPHVVSEWFLPGHTPAACDWHRSGPRGTTISYPQEYKEWLTKYRYGRTSVSATARLEILRPLNKAVYYLEHPQSTIENGVLVQATGSGLGTLTCDGKELWRGSFPVTKVVDVTKGFHSIEISQDDGSFRAVKIEVR